MLFLSRELKQMCLNHDVGLNLIESEVPAWPRGVNLFFCPSLLRVSMALKFFFTGLPVLVHSTVQVKLVLYECTGEPTPLIPLLFASIAHHVGKERL